MYEIFIHNETHTHTHGGNKYILSQINQPEQLQLTLKYIFNTFLSVFTKLLLSVPTAISVFEGGQFVRVVNRITFEGSAMANGNTCRWQSWMLPEESHACIGNIDVVLINILHYFTILKWFR